jgi:MFS transporter, DHA1 family, multidrug resistance protein
MVACYPQDMSKASPSSTHSARAEVSSTTAALVLGILLGLQPVVTDLFLPALPKIRQDLDASMPLTQWTMSGLMLAFGIGQLIWGPVSDRFGRKPVLLSSLSLLTLAGIGSSLSSSMSELVAWRVAQGASLSAVVMCGRAIVRDLYEPGQGAMVMSRALSVLGVCAIVSPTLGGALAHFFGWRAALLGMSVLIALALLLVAFRWPETATRNLHALSLGAYQRQLRSMARHRGFRAHALLVASTFSGLFVFLSASSFVYIESLGLSPAQYGAVMASASLAYLFGTSVSRKLLARYGMTGAVRIASITSLLAGLAFAAVAFFDLRNLWALLLPQWVYLLAHGVHQPCGQTGAVAPFPRAAGVAGRLCDVCGGGAHRLWPRRCIRRHDAPDGLGHCRLGWHDGAGGPDAGAAPRRRACAHARRLAAARGTGLRSWRWR